MLYALTQILFDAIGAGALIALRAGRVSSSSSSCYYPRG